MRFSFAAPALVTHVCTMIAVDFCIHKEPPYYVAQCLDVDVSSFGETVDEAIFNLKEAVELHLEDHAT